LDTTSSQLKKEKAWYYYNSNQLIQTGVSNVGGQKSKRVVTCNNFSCTKNSSKPAAPLSRREESIMSSEIESLQNLLAEEKARSKRLQEQVQFLSRLASVSHFHGVEI
jgi:hypothetical protein